MSPRGYIFHHNATNQHTVQRISTTMNKQGFSRMTAPSILLSFRRPDECLPFSELEMQASDLPIYLTVENGIMHFVIELSEAERAKRQQRIILN